MMNGFAITLAALLSAIGSVSYTCRADQFEAALEQWKTKKHALPIPDGSRIVLEIFQGRDPVPQDEVERLARSAPLDRNSEHQYRLALSINKHGGDRRRVELFFANRGLWRINVDYLTYSAIEYADSAKGTDRPWLLTPNQLQVGSDSRGLEAVDSEFAVTSTLAAYLVSLQSVIFRQEAEIADVVEHGGRASFVIARDDRLLRVSGQFEAGGRRSLDAFQIETIEITDPSGVPLGKSSVSDWRFNPHFGREIAHSYESFDSDGSVEMSIRLLEAAPLATDIQALTALPARPDGEDPVRGAYTFTSIYDLGRNEAAIFDAKSGDRLSSQSLGTFGDYRRHVIAALIVLVGVAVFVKLRRDAKW